MIEDHIFNGKNGTSIVEYDEFFLDLSYKWLSDELIRKMTMAPLLTKQEQKKWFEKLKDKADYRIFGVIHNNEKVGVVGLKHINKQERVAEYFGYIGEKQYWGNGIGRFMLDSMFAYASSLELNKLTLIVAVNNERAIKLYERYGFVRISQDMNVIKMQKCI